MEVTSSMIVNARYSYEDNTSFCPDFLEKKIFACFGEISRLSPGDADIFRSTFRREAICYANSWLYILRATRNSEGEFGYKFVGRDTVMGIGYRNNTVYLVHPMGVGRFETTLDLCYQIHRSTPYAIILKKADQKLYKYLHASNLFQGQAGDGLLFEEEAYPEHTLYLDRLYEPGLQGDHQSVSLIRKVKRFEKSSMHLLAQTDVASIENAPGFRSLFGANPDKYRSYLRIIREASSRTDRYKICAYVDENATVHGLYISERLGEESMGLYCAVSSRAYPGITEWMDYDFFRQLFHDRIHYVYLGGSETEGVHSYVQKLLPLAPPYLMRPMGCIPMRNYSV